MTICQLEIEYSCREVIFRMRMFPAFILKYNDSKHNILTNQHPRVVNAIVDSWETIIFSKHVTHRQDQRGRAPLECLNVKHQSKPLILNLASGPTWYVTMRLFLKLMFRLNFSLRNSLIVTTTDYKHTTYVKLSSLAGCQYMAAWQNFFNFFLKKFQKMFSFNFFF